MKNKKVIYNKKNCKKILEENHEMAISYFDNILLPSIKMLKIVVSLKINKGIVYLSIDGQKYFNVNDVIKELKKGK